MEPSGFFYLYLYPIVSSIFAGFIFWLIFSYFPDRQRKKSFGVGVFNDLLAVNARLFHYFDIFLKSQIHSPSQFQDKIHSSQITEEEFSIFLQNKILRSDFDFYPEISGRLLPVGDELRRCRDEIDETIKRLYSFNLFLSNQEVQLLRNIQEKIFRYDLDRAAVTQIGAQVLRPVDPSLSYMQKVLVELLDDYKKLRSTLFRKKMIDRSFSIQKVQYYFYSGYYEKCIVECDRWIKRFPFDSELHISYKIRSFVALRKTNDAYLLLESLLERNVDAVGFRDLFYSMISDSTAFSIILKRIAMDRIEEMKSVYEHERVVEKTFLASNTDLKKFFNHKKNLLTSKSI